MLLLFKLGLSGVFGSGEQYMSWVSIDDAVAMIQYVMTNDSLEGPDLLSHRMPSTTVSSPNL